MTSNKIQFTKIGYQKLKDELSDLENNKRKKAIDRLSSARAMGDLSENSEYHAAKEEQAFVEGRIKEIEELLKRGEVVEIDKESGASVGSEVTVEKDGKKIKYHIVGEFEADPINQKLSATSPIGKALLGSKKGDIVAVEVPAGKLEYKILEVK